MYGVWVDGGADKHIDNNERAFWKKNKYFYFFLHLKSFRYLLAHATQFKL